MLSTVWFYLQTRLHKNDEGQGMVEYGLILALVAIVAIVGLKALGVSLDGILGKEKDGLENATGTV